MDPGRLKALYRSLPPRLRARVPPRLEAWVQRRILGYLGRDSTAPVRLLEAKLRAGIIEPAATELAALTRPGVSRPRVAAEAAFALARWHLARGDAATALDSVVAMRRLHPPASREPRQYLLEADCLARLGRGAAARALIAARSGGQPPNPCVALTLAATWSSDAETDPTAAEGARLLAIDSAFRRTGLCGIAKARPDLPLSIDNLRGTTAEEGGEAAPCVSVIVPVYRHWDLVPGLLACLAAQALPRERLEILLVNNGTAEDVPSLDLPTYARLLTCPAPGAYAARNHGAAEAAGALLAFTDADCRPAPGWLAAMAAAAERLPGRLLAGPVRVIGEATTPYAIYDRIRGIPQERYVRLGYATTANLVVPRGAFGAAGGFDATRFSGGDADFCRRAGRAGHAIALVPEAVVEHPCRADWDALATKARRVKGGQITGGTLPLRLQWFVRTLTPPLRATARFLRAECPWPERRVAIGVLYRLWLVELAELARLLAGGTPERR